jgi:hypothetical protein
MEMKCRPGDRVTFFPRPSMTVIFPAELSSAEYWSTTRPTRILGPREEAEALREKSSKKARKKAVRIFFIFIAPRPLP